MVNCSTTTGWCQRFQKRHHFNICRIQGWKLVSSKNGWPYQFGKRSTSTETLIMKQRCLEKAWSDLQLRWDWVSAWSQDREGIYSYRYQLEEGQKHTCNITSGNQTKFTVMTCVSAVFKIEMGSIRTEPTEKCLVKPDTTWMTPAGWTAAFWWQAIGSLLKVCTNCLPYCRLIGWTFSAF